MKVKELIEVLKTYDQECNVVLTIENFNIYETIIWDTYSGDVYKSEISSKGECVLYAKGGPD